MSGLASDFRRALLAGATPIGPYREARNRSMRPVEERRIKLCLHPETTVFQHPFMTVEGPRTCRTAWAGPHLTVEPCACDAYLLDRRGIN